MAVGAEVEDAVDAVVRRRAQRRAGRGGDRLRVAGDVGRRPAARPGDFADVVVVVLVVDPEAVAVQHVGGQAAARRGDRVAAADVGGLPAAGGARATQFADVRAGVDEVDPFLGRIQHERRERRAAGCGLGAGERGEVAPVPDAARDRQFVDVAVDVDVVDRRVGAVERERRQRRVGGRRHRTRDVGGQVGGRPDAVVVRDLDHMVVGDVVERRLARERGHAHQRRARCGRDAGGGGAAGADRGEVGVDRADAEGAARHQVQVVVGAEVADARGHRRRDREARRGGGRDAVAEGGRQPVAIRRFPGGLARGDRVEAHALRAEVERLQRCGGGRARGLAGEGGDGHRRQGESNLHVSSSCSFW